MALVHEQSCDCLKSELELFSVAPTQTCIESGCFRKYYPITTLDQGGPIEFKITGGSDKYIDVNNIILYTKCRIMYQEKDTIPAEVASGTNKIFNANAKVCPINYFHATQFKNVEVYLNGKSITPSDNLYPYRAYFETLLSHGTDSKKNQLKMGLFCKDTNTIDNNFEEFETTFVDVNKKTANMGNRWRFEVTKFSRVFEMVGRIHCDLFSQNKMIPGNCALRIRLQRADPKFSLVAKSTTKKYEVSIDSACLYVRQEQISPSVLHAHELALQKGRFKFPMRKIQMKFYTKSSGQQDISENNLIEGTLPRKVIIGLVKSQAFHGSYQSSPFNFAHFDVDEVALRVDGRPLPFDCLKMNYSNKQCLLGYLSLMQASNRIFHDSDLGICPMSDYMNGNALYGFDLTPDLSNDGYFQLTREGKLSLDIKLANSSTDSITIVCYFEFDGLLTMDENRTVYYDE